MSSRVKRHKDELSFLKKCTNKQRKDLINSASSDLVKAIADIALTAIKGGFPLNSSQKKMVRSNASTFKQLTTKQRTLKQKKRLLASQRGGSILPLMLSLLTSIL